MQYEPRLDSLRALAALLVIGMHTGLLEFGWIGVQFFFVLSGFLVSGLIFNAKDEGIGQLPYLRSFYTRRAARLLPLYFGYLGLLGIGWALCGQPTTYPAAAPALFSYTLNFRALFPGHPGSDWWAHLWSLAVEWQLYLVWPFLIWPFPVHRRAQLFLAFIAIGPVLRLLTYLACLKTGLASEPSPNIGALDAVYILPFSQVDAFALGALLRLPGWQIRLATGRIFGASLLALAFGSAVVLFAAEDRGYALQSLGWPHRMPDAAQWIWGYSLLNLFSACVIAGTLTNRQFIWRIADTRPLQYLGKISYGIYVFHLPSIVMVKTWTPWASGASTDCLRLLIILALTVLAAHVSYRFWERRFLKRLSAPRRGDRSTFSFQS